MHKHAIHSAGRYNWRSAAVVPAVLRVTRNKLMGQKWLQLDRSTCESSGIVICERFLMTKARLLPQPLTNCGAGRATEYFLQAAEGGCSGLRLVCFILAIFGGPGLSTPL